MCEFTFNVYCLFEGFDFIKSNPKIIRVFNKEVNGVNDNLQLLLI